MDDEQIICLQSESTPEQIILREALKYRLEELVLIGALKDADRCSACLTNGADHEAESQICRWKRYVCARACMLLSIFPESMSAPNYKKMCVIYKELALTGGEKAYLGWDVRRVLAGIYHSEPQVPQQFVMLPLNHGYKIGRAMLLSAID
jgi:hypothetical protein